MGGALVFSRGSIGDSVVRVTWLKRIAIGLGVLLIAGAAFLIPTIWGKPWIVEHFYLRVLFEELLDEPLLLTQLRILESAGLHFHARELPDQSLALRDRQADRTRKHLEILKNYDRASLREDRRLSYDVMLRLLETSFEHRTRFKKHGYALDQLNGLHVRFPEVMVNYHRIERRRDALDYLARVEKLGAAFDEIVRKAETLEKEGFTIPRFLLRKMERDVRNFADKPLEENPLRIDFRKKLETSGSIESGDRSELEATLDRVLSGVAIPAYQRLAEGLVRLAERAPDDAGVWHLPDGDAYYAICAREMTTTSLAPDEIHRIGLEEVARIQEEMRTILHGQGVATSTRSFGDGLRAFSADPRWYFPDSAQGRAKILDRYRLILSEIGAKLDTMFTTNPKAPLDVARVPEFREKTAPGAYYFPSALDGSRPGTFFANLRDVREHRKYAMRTLAYHEGVPGHHLQLSIALSQKQLPLFRQLVPLPAYAEGWALYAEQLAAEQGFESDPLDRLGYLDAQLFRAVRLVVDTGIHAKRWTRERAVGYFNANSGMALSEIETEVDRYAAWPGQALAYMVGRLRIIELRERAKQKLGDRFDLRAFHDAVLLPAALPLDMLSAEVDRWIASRLASGSAASGPAAASGSAGTPGSPRSEMPERQTR